jgi:hypothetical protein
VKLPGPNPKIWRGYRNCTRCTAWRPVSDFPIRKTRSGFEQIEAVCNACKWAREKARYNGLTKEEKREYGRRVNRRTRRRKQKQLRMIEHQREVLEHRERQIARQEEKLAAVRNKYRIPRGTSGDNPIAVDIVPFRMWLLRQHRQHEYRLDLLSESIGQDPRQVERWLQGYNWNGAGRDPSPVQAINIVTVDEVGVAFGDAGLLERLYPLEVDE